MVFNIQGRLQAVMCCVYTDVKNEKKFHYFVMKHPPIQCIDAMTVIITQVL